VDQIGGFDQTECDAEGVDPECRWIYRVAKRDVACDAFVEAAAAEDAKGRYVSL
jgi:hypothetical protein